MLFHLYVYIVAGTRICIVQKHIQPITLIFEKKFGLVFVSIYRFYWTIMSSTTENKDLGEPNEPTVIESLKSLDMNVKESENTKVDSKDTNENKGKNNEIIVLDIFDLNLWADSVIWINCNSNL